MVWPNSFGPTTHNEWEKAMPPPQRWFFYCKFKSTKQQFSRPCVKRYSTLHAFFSIFSADSKSQKCQGFFQKSSFIILMGWQSFTSTKISERCLFSRSCALFAGGPLGLAVERAMRNTAYVFCKPVTHNRHIPCIMYVVFCPVQSKLTSQYHPSTSNETRVQISIALEERENKKQTQGSAACHLPYTYTLRKWHYIIILKHWAFNF